MSEWDLNDSLADQVGAKGTSTVLLIRGDVIRRYPDTEFFLVIPDESGELFDNNQTIPAERSIWPAFKSSLDAQTLLVGFDVTPEKIRNDGYYISIQEPVVGPRFGLDTADLDHLHQQPASWADLTWAHVAASAEDFEIMTHIHLANIDWLGSISNEAAVWGRNSAHFAGITFQQAFRLLLPAAYLLPESET